MERTRVSSSNIASVGYDPSISVLEIEFHSGGVYQYLEVPGSEYRGLMEAPSKGRYFHRRIRNHYQDQKIR